MRNKITEKIKSLSRYIIVFIAILLIFSLVKNLIKISEIKKSIVREQQRIERLKAENRRLNDELAKTQSSEFIEKQLRDNLGLAKSGEIVLVLPDEDTLRKLAPQIPEEEETLPDPNWKRWLKLFF